MREAHMLICPVCGSTEWAIRYKISKWDIGECFYCGFARIDPLPPKEARAGYYSEDIVRERNIKKRSFLRNFAKNTKHFFKDLTSRGKDVIFYAKLCKNLSSGAKILDVGCGDATFLDLAKKRFVCAGIEISDYLVSHARKKEDIEIIEGDFQSKNFNNDNRYDGITMLALLEHLDDPFAAIKKCFSLLNNGGALFMKTVNYGCLNRVIKNGGWTGFRPPDHIVYFSPSNLKMLLGKIGFKKIKIQAWPFNDNMYCEAYR